MTSERVAPKRRFADEHFIQDAPECPDVGSGIDPFSARLLRRHVARRADDQHLHGHRRECQARVGASVVRPVERFREAEIEHLHLTVVGQLDVRRLEIAMHDAARMRCFERLRDLPRHGNGVANRQPAAPQPLRERRTCDILQHEKACVTGLFQAVDRRDAWMIQRRECARLALQPPHAIVEQQLGAHNLERHRSVQRRVGGFVNHAHAADADALLDSVMTERRVLAERRQRFVEVVHVFTYRSRSVVFTGGERPMQSRVRAAHSHFTVAGETPTTSAVFSTVMSPKNRRATIRD
jgi:hypothetical protein